MKCDRCDMDEFEFDDKLATGKYRVVERTVKCENCGDKIVYPVLVRKKKKAKK